MTETYSKGNPLDRLILPRLWKPDESPLMLADNELNRRDDLKSMKKKYRYDTIVQDHVSYVLSSNTGSEIGYVSADCKLVNSTDSARTFDTNEEAEVFLKYLIDEKGINGKLSVMHFCDTLTHAPVSRKKPPLESGFSM